MDKETSKSTEDTTNEGGKTSPNKHTTPPKKRIKFSQKNDAVSTPTTASTPSTPLKENTTTPNTVTTTPSSSNINMSLIERIFSGDILEEEEDEEYVPESEDEEDDIDVSITTPKKKKNSVNNQNDNNNNNNNIIINLDKSVSPDNFFAYTSSSAPDFIARRTRAQYSLIDVDLEQLESFLQVSPPSSPQVRLPPEPVTIQEVQIQDDNIQYPDPHEEYRLFLSMLQHDGHEPTLLDDENDADFHCDHSDSEVEEYRNDKAVLVSRKEMKELEELRMEEGLNGFNMEGVENGITGQTAINVDATNQENKNNTSETRRTRRKKREAAQSNTDQSNPINSEDIMPPPAENPNEVQYHLDSPTHQESSVFTPAQISQLQKQLSDHVQLLFQTFLLSRSRGPDYFTISRWSFGMIHTLKRYRDVTLTYRKLTTQIYTPPPPVPILLKSSSQSPSKLPPRVNASISRSKHEIKASVYDIPILSKIAESDPNIYVTRDNIDGIIQPLSQYFDQTLKIVHSDFSRGKNHRLSFTPTEEKLLEIGVSRYGTNWQTIQELYLPSKTAQQLFHRFKNLIASNAPDNPMKQLKETIGKLNDDEKKILREAVLKYGEKFDMISKDLLPQKSPFLLEKIYKKHIRGRLRKKKEKEPKSPIKVKEPRPKKERSKAHEKYKRIDKRAINSMNPTFLNNGSKVNYNDNTPEETSEQMLESESDGFEEADLSDSSDEDFSFEQTILNNHAHTAFLPHGINSQYEDENDSFEMVDFEDDESESEGEIVDLSSTDEEEDELEFTQTAFNYSIPSKTDNAVTFTENNNNHHNFSNTTPITTNDNDNNSTTYTHSITPIIINDTNTPNINNTHDINIDNTNNANHTNIINNNNSNIDVSVNNVNNDHPPNTPTTPNTPPNTYSTNNNKKASPIHIRTLLDSKEVAWKKEEDRSILFAVKKYGASRSTWEMLTQSNLENMGNNIDPLKEKDVHQIEARYNQLLQLLKKNT